MSISPFELRLGNLVNVINEEGIIYNCTVVSISNDSISVMKDGTGMVVEPEHLSPITLTEDWLVRLGFELIKGSFYLEGRTVYVDSKKWYYVLNFHIITLKYIHQLQNIVYFNTGTELTIKETV